MGESLGKLKTEELEKRIKERIAQIKKIVGFVEKLTDELGTVIKYNQGSCHTNVARELKGFSDFTFLADTGRSMMGGNDFHVWYHPGVKEVDTKKSISAFSVYYQVSVEESEVSVFDPSTEWQDALDKLIERQDEIIAEAKKQKISRGRQQQLREEDKEKREQLLKRAKELML